MHEHHFTVPAPFASVVDALEAIDDLVVDEQSDIHCVCTLGRGAAVIIRPAYPDSADVIVAGFEDEQVAPRLADQLARLLGVDVPAPRPFEHA